MGAHKDIRIRTKPFRDDIGASQDKNGKALMAALAGGCGSGKLQVGTAKDKKG